MGPNSENSLRRNTWKSWLPVFLQVFFLLVTVPVTSFYVALIGRRDIPLELGFTGFSAAVVASCILIIVSCIFGILHKVSVAIWYVIPAIASCGLGVMQACVIKPPSAPDAFLFSACSFYFISVFTGYTLCLLFCEGSLAWKTAPSNRVFDFVFQIMPMTTAALFCSFLQIRWNSMNGVYRIMLAILVVSICTIAANGSLLLYKAIKSPFGIRSYICGLLLSTFVVAFYVPWYILVMKNIYTIRDLFFPLPLSTWFSLAAVGCNFVLLFREGAHSNDLDTKLSSQDIEARQQQQPFL